jgi:hypothetical protein
MVAKEDATRADLMKALDTAEKTAVERERDGQAMVQTARAARDTIEVMRTWVTENAWPPIDPDRARAVIHVWQMSARTGESLGSSLPFLPSYGSATAQAINTTVAFAMTEPALGANHAERLSVGIKIPEIVDAIQASFKRLGIAGPGPHRESPAHLLDEVRNAFVRPATENATPSIVIPLRSCMEVTVDRLLSRREVQTSKPAKRALKIELLGTQCGGPGLDDAHFRRVGDEYDKTINSLSTLKDKNLDRSELILWVKRGITSIHALVEAIDESKLRSEQ